MTENDPVVELHPKVLLCEWLRGDDEKTRKERTK